MDIEEIYNFLMESQGIKRNKLAPSVDLCYDLGIEGDDFFDLEEEFMNKYGVDMNSYRWYFHHGEEGWNIGAYFSPAPYQQVEHIPVTPKMLLEAAENKAWPIEYPPHSIKERDTEMAINKAIVFLLISFVVVCVINVLA